MTDSVSSYPIVLTCEYFDCGPRNIASETLIFIYFISHFCDYIGIFSVVKCEFSILYLFIYLLSYVARGYSYVKPRVVVGLVLYVSWMLYISLVLTLVTPRGKSVLRLWGFEKG